MSPTAANSEGKSKPKPEKKLPTAFSNLFGKVQGKKAEEAEPKTASGKKSKADGKNQPGSSKKEEAKTPRRGKREKKEISTEGIEQLSIVQSNLYIKTTLGTNKIWSLYNNMESIPLRVCVVFISRYSLSCL